MNQREIDDELRRAAKHADPRVAAMLRGLADGTQGRRGPSKRELPKGDDLARPDPRQLSLPWCWP